MASGSRQVSVEREVTAEPQRLWEMVSDVTRMGEWSPETVSVTWLGGATGPAVGARFKGKNRNGPWRWSTLCTVTACEPGQVFEFRVSKAGLGIARWRYDFEASGDGCRVTETWIDERGGLVALMGKPVSGVGDRPNHNREGMAQTLARLAAAAERASAA